MKRTAFDINRAFHRKHVRKERDAQRGRLGSGRYSILIKEISTAIKLAFEAGATSSLFGLEGPLRAGIRADLCRQGWRWQDADDMARDMLAEAFRVVRAIRPDWDEGQREWTIHAGTLIERTRCACCHGPLPEGHHKFCGRGCAASHQQRLSRRKEASDEMAVMRAINLI